MFFSLVVCSTCQSESNEVGNDADLTCLDHAVLGDDLACTVLIGVLLLNQQHAPKGASPQRAINGIVMKSLEHE